MQKIFQKVTEVQKWNFKKYTIYKCIKNVEYN